MAGSALFTAVTGLQSFQAKLDVLANNIANVNTTGFRSGRVQFQDLFSQTLVGGSGPSGALGSTNSQQVGLGVRVGSIDLNFNDGVLNTTGVASDLAIQGNGFFILSDGQRETYTRDGAFSVSTDGRLINSSTGQLVYGYDADSNGVVNSNSIPGALDIPLGGAPIVQATTLTSLIGNLSAESNIADPLPVPPIPATEVTRTLRVFDSLGVARDVVVNFTKSVQLDDAGTLYNAWTYEALFDGNDVLNTGGLTGAVIFNNDGSFRSVGTEVAGVFTITVAGTPTISIPVGLFPGPSFPSTPFEFTIDLTDVTELSGNSELTNPFQDGFPRGTLQDFVIGENGLINGVFSNGLTRVLGQVALATFTNLGGLERVGGNQFRETPSSGIALVGVSNSNGRGSISGGVLEGSNVDLGNEFSNMIITQRGFQANARTVTAADTVLQETVNLIR